MPELYDTLALAERFRRDAGATSQSEYAILMLQAAEDLEPFVRARPGASVSVACGEQAA